MELELETLRNPQTLRQKLEDLALELTGSNFPAERIFLFNEDGTGENPTVWETFCYPPKNLAEIHPLVFKKNQTGQGPEKPEEGGELGVRGQIWTLLKNRVALILFFKQGKTPTCIYGLYDPEKKLQTEAKEEISSTIREV